LFCTITESARDINQHLVDANVDLPPHPFEAQMNIQHVPLRARAEVPSKLLQVYVDDFCYASMEAKDGCHILRIRHASIHGIHSVFPQPEVTGHVDGKEPISGPKLKKGDASPVKNIWLASYSMGSNGRSGCHRQRRQRTLKKSI
jgi:hypothetical protein